MSGLGLGFASRPAQAAFAVACWLENSARWLKGQRPATWRPVATGGEVRGPIPRPFGRINDRDRELGFAPRSTKIGEVHVEIDAATSTEAVSKLIDAAIETGKGSKRNLG